MARVLVVGFGNPLRSDDGLGWHVAKRLSADHQTHDVQVIASYQLTPELADLASRADLILFVDADCKGKPGTLSCERIHSGSDSRQSSHDLSPCTILQLVRQLYDRAPIGYLLTVAGESFEMGESLSKSVTSAIPILMDRIKQLIEEHRRAT